MIQSNKPHTDIFVHHTKYMYAAGRTTVDSILKKSVRLRDTFAGKMRLRNLGPRPSCEKVVEILPAKVSRRCPYQVTISGKSVATMPFIIFFGLQKSID